VGAGVVAPADLDPLPLLPLPILLLLSDLFDLDEVTSILVSFADGDDEPE
jgi:hypothetical protein